MTLNNRLTIQKKTFFKDIY